MKQPSIKPKHQWRLLRASPPPSSLRAWVMSGSPAATPPTSGAPSAKRMRTSVVVDADAAVILSRHGMSDFKHMFAAVEGTNHVSMQMLRYMGAGCAAVKRVAVIDIVAPKEKGRFFEDYAHEIIAADKHVFLRAAASWNILEPDMSQEERADACLSEMSRRLRVRARA